MFFRKANKCLVLFHPRPELSGFALFTCTTSVQGKTFSPIRVISDLYVESLQTFLTMSSLVLQVVPYGLMISEEGSLGDHDSIGLVGSLILIIAIS